MQPLTETTTTCRSGPASASSGGAEKGFDWAALVPVSLHPLKVAIIEALLWIDRPLSAVELGGAFSPDYEIANVSYHLRKLAELGAVVKTGERQRRGALQRFYYFPDELAVGPLGR